MWELSHRAAQPWPDLFANWFDQQMMSKGLHNRANTAENNRWIASFKGRTALQAEQLDLLQELFGDAHDFYYKGPSNLWIALWGEPDELWSLCKTKLNTDAHFLEDSDWKEIISSKNNELDICEALRIFEGEVMLATESNFQDLPFGYFVEAIALYRLHSYASKIFKLNSDGIGAYRSLFQCALNADTKITLFFLGIFSDIKEELISMEIEKIKANKNYCINTGLSYPPSEDAARKYAMDPLAAHPNLDRWDDLKFDWVSSDA